MIFEAVAIVGPGRMGLALGSALEGSGEVRTLTFFGRHPEPPPHPLFFEGKAEYVFGVEPLTLDTSVLILAVPDDVVPQMAFTLAAHGAAPDACSAFHLSASLPTDVLAPLHERGYGVGSLLPLVDVRHSLQGGGRLADSYFAVTGSPETIATARRLTAAIGASLLTVPAARRPLFHAAVAMASGYVPPLLGLSMRLMERAGVTSDESLPVLSAIVRDSVRSVEERGLVEAMPNRFSGGELESVALHLRALDPEDQRLYAILGIETLRLAGGSVDEATRVALTDLFGKYAELETSGTGY